MAERRRVGLSGTCLTSAKRTCATGSYVRHLTDSPLLEELTWKYMRWFYQQMQRVYAPSRAYLEYLEENGFEADKLRLLPRGVDTELFHPERRDPAFWGRYGLGDGPKLLYVGRVSREKNLDRLLRSFGDLLESGRRAELVVVGDGPYLDELRTRHQRPEVLFTGYLHGEDLATAFASADLFVFPSTTDTFGNAVLEAQASGLAAVVSDRGGAQEIVGPPASGRVVDVEAPGLLTAAMAELLDDGVLRSELAARGLGSARGASWQSLLDELWPMPGAVSEPEVEAAATPFLATAPRLAAATA